MSYIWPIHTTVSRFVDEFARLITYYEHMAYAFCFFLQLLYITGCKPSQPWCTSWVHVTVCSSWVAKRAGCKINWAQSSARTTEIRSQSSTRTKRDLGTILWAIDENVGTNLQAFTVHQLSENTKKKIIIMFKFFFFFQFSQRYINRAGR